MNRVVKRLVLLVLTSMLIIQTIPYVDANPTERVLWTYDVNTYVDCVAISGDGKYASISADDGILRFFSTSSSTPLWTISGLTAMHQVALSYDGRYLAVAHNRYAALYSTSGSGSLLWRYDTMASPVRIDISRDGNYVAAGNQNIFFFTRTGGINYQWYSPSPAWVDRIFVSQAGESVLAIWDSTENGMSLYEGAGYAPSSPSTQPNVEEWSRYPIKKAKQSQDGQYVVCADLASVSFLRGLSGNGTPLWQDSFAALYVSISHDGSRMTATNQFGAQTRFYSMNSSTPLWATGIGYFSEVDYTGNYILGGRLNITGVVNAEMNLLWVNTNILIRNQEEGWSFGDSVQTSDYCARTIFASAFSSSLVRIYVIGSIPNTSLSYSPTYIDGADVYTSNATQFNLTADSMAPYTTKYQIDSGPLLTYINNFTLSGQSEGSHTISYYSYDITSNTESTKNEVVIFDNAPPSTNCSILPKYFRVPSLTIGYNYSDAFSGVKNVSLYYRYNNGIWNKVLTDEPPTGNFTFDTIGDGTYEFYTNGVDNILNVESAPINNETWTIIDTISPTINLISPINNSVILPGTIIEFQINDENELHSANYSVNNGPTVNMSVPYNISTSGWSDDNYTIEIQTMDEAGNFKNESYLFIVDSTKPVISLLTPSNNSVISAGTIIDFDINDLHFSNANYSINGGPVQILGSPFNINTNGWLDGAYDLKICAIDEVGNNVTDTYSFIIDSTAPSIFLSSPVNNSIILSGTIIDFIITDIHLASASYSIDSESVQNLSSPYDISTSGWPDGPHSIEIQAVDDAGNDGIEIFQFTIDTTLPLIVLNSPANNSVVSDGTILNFTVSDVNLGNVNYSVNGGLFVTLSPPYDITTAGWVGGNYSIVIRARDLAGNELTHSYNFVIDSTAPEIVLVSPANNTLIPAGTNIDLDIIDLNIDLVTYSVNGGMFQNISNPYDIHTDGWADGDYTIQVNAIDLSGNSDCEIYQFTIDSTVPSILLNQPGNNSAIKPGTVLNFSVSDIHLNIVNYSINGEIALPFSEPFDIETAAWSEGIYLITISANDTVGNSVIKIFTIKIDLTPPDSAVTPIANYWNKAALTIRYTANDTNAIDNTTLWFRFSVNNVSWDAWTPVSVDLFNLSSWLFNFSENNGYYEFYSIANDTAGNIESAPTTADARCSYDASSPEADAGPDMVVHEGTLVSFDASASTDNFNIVNYSWTFTFNGTPVSLFDVSPSFNFTLVGNYTVTLTVRDAAGNSDTDTMIVTVTPSPDSDNDGIPDSEDVFPSDPDEWLDTDDDGIGNNADNDDDGDGYLDTWETFLGTDSLDSTDYLPDSDSDGIPDGDAANSQPWMDSDDDGDGVPDDIDLDPLDPDVGEIADDTEVPGDNSFGNYFWIILILIIAGVLGAALILARKRRPEVEEALETEQCPKCGFEIEKGSECPFCTDESSK